MMNGSKTKTYSVFVALLLLASCNEKVNPSLQNSNTTTTPIPTATVDKYFKLVNTSDSALNYHLHKTGSGNYDTKCEINATSFSTALYAGVPSTYDITCFMESEELALIFNGVDWNIEASANTCDYVAYTPYTFFQFQPGNSTRTVDFISCADGIGTVGGEKPQCGAYYQDDPLFTGASPDLAIDPLTVSTSADLCRFDYSKAGGPNCDEGTITLRTTPYTTTDTPAPGTIVQGAPTVSFISCGGSAANCINGPVKDVPSLAAGSGGATVLTELIKTTKDQNYSQKYSIAPPRSKGYTTNMYAANFMRQCTGVNYDNGAYTPGLSPNLGFNPSQTTFNPDVMDRLSKNIKRAFDHSSAGVTIFDYTDGAVVNPARFLAQNEKVLANAVSPTSGKKVTSPFYNFYCLNKAQDVKARIRVIVREWDRAFEVDPIMEVMSDVYNVGDALMDNAYDELGNLDFYDSFNDKQDWDDFLLYDTPINTGVPATDVPACEVPHPHTLESFSSDSFPGSGL